MLSLQDYPYGWSQAVDTRQIHRTLDRKLEETNKEGLFRRKQTKVFLVVVYGRLSAGVEPVEQKHSKRQKQLRCLFVTSSKPQT